MADFESGRQFFTDPVTAQTFYREPINGVYSPWMPLGPSDYHPPRPETHNVSKPISMFFHSFESVLVVVLDLPT